MIQYSIHEFLPTASRAYWCLGLIGCKYYIPILVTFASVYDYALRSVVLATPAYDHGSVLKTKNIMKRGSFFILTVKIGIFSDSVIVEHV